MKFGTVITQDLIQIKTIFFVIGMKTIFIRLLMGTTTYTLKHKRIIYLNEEQGKRFGEKY